MNNDEAAKLDRMEADLVIIGGGGAGLSAAVTAAEKGSRNVIVLEKRGTIGGNTALSVRPFGADSPAQKRAAIDTMLSKTVLVSPHEAANEIAWDNSD